MLSVIVYEFYTKEIASKALINARSAMSASVKRTVFRKYTDVVWKVRIRDSYIITHDRIYIVYCIKQEGY